MSVYTAEQIEAVVENDAFSGRAFEFRFASETCRIWNGNTDRKLFDSRVWDGMRGLLEAPTIDFSAKGYDEKGVFTIRGMKAQIEEDIWNYEEEVLGRHIIEYEFIMLTTDLTVIGPGIVNQVYEMQGMESEQSGSTLQGGGPTYDLRIMVNTLFGARSEASYGRFTELDQRGRYPGVTDKMFNQVPEVAKGVPVKLV